MAPSVPVSVPLSATDLVSRDSIAATYRQRLAAARERIRLVSRREFACAMARLAVFIAGVVMAIVLVPQAKDSSSPGTLAPLALPVFVLVVLFWLHGRFVRAINLARLSETFYKNGLARLEHTWIGTGVRGGRYLPENHPYAADLDLFGKGSLYELLCLAATPAGQEALAAWLLAPADPAEIRARQEAVRELAPRLDEREEIFKLLRHSPKVLDTAALARWAAAPPVRFRPWERLAAVALSCASVTAFVAWQVGTWGFQPFLRIILLQAALAWFLGRRVEQAIRFCEQTGRGLLTFVRIFSFLESATFESPRLRELQSLFRWAGRRASAEVRRLDRLVGMLNDGRRNMVLFLPARLLSWTLHCAVAIEAWRQRNGSRMVEWVRAIGELEALCSLAAFAHENPDHPFPELAEGPPLLEAEALGHPLLPAAGCVRNDLRLDATLRLFVISGSNMSGKSTFLRTVGINLVLAQAGAPVRAARMRLTPLAPYALIRKDDSLRDGISRFYREIMRVRELTDMALRQPTLLFLIDEIFDGTNSHDRTVAAEAIVRTLTRRGALGLITSHDLALTEIARKLAPAAANAHFEDQIDGDRLAFDYRLRPGAVQRGNALLLMRSIGLDV